MNLNRVVGAPAGIIRVRVTGAPWSDSDVRKTVRTWAMGQAHTLVGGAQNVRSDGADTLVDFAVVTRTARDAHPADAPVVAPPAPEAPLDPIAALTAQVAALAAQVAALTGAAPVAKVPAAKREVPAFIVAKAKAREAATCKACKDFGVVRGSGPRKGEAYVTANGAKGATASVKCPACKGKARNSA